jgi:hypothetical protein
MSDLILHGEAFGSLKEQAEILRKSGFLPGHVKTPEQAIAIAIMGNELGIAPMTSYTNISVINGKPTLEAKMQLALVFRRYPNAPYSVLESTDKIAVVELGRPNGKTFPFSYTIEEASRAGLLGKDNWKKYPKDMLLWRAVSRSVRAIYPECVSTAPYTPEEIEETIAYAPINVMSPVTIANKALEINCSEFKEQLLSDLAIVDPENAELKERIRGSNNISELRNYREVVSELALT